MTAFWNVGNVHSGLSYFDVHVTEVNYGAPTVVLYSNVLWHTPAYFGKVFAVLNLTYNLEHNTYFYILSVLTLRGHSV